ncbi:hypothetical protein B1J93_17810 [Leptospira kirschneri serovar Pomona]|uniref:Uncharacterized protein n=1 Tax=Leptospira kirschneri serovar Pomona TaxID=561005 RepID=A0A1T1DH87_9LEPT|nr:hypothetical protein [Leptospira kirschneri]OOV40202.1 hypothetical protein B1J93_17810 [Leptospira kirschneri serovar Pomona]
MKLDLQKNFNKQTFIGVIIGVATLAGSYLAQNFVPESLDTKKKARPIIVPIIVGVLAAIFIPKKEYKPFAILGAAIMLLFGILKTLDEEKSADKKILGKLFGVTLAGERQELEFQNISELKGFVDAATQVDGDGYLEIQAPSSREVHGEEVLYGEEEIHGEEVLYGDDEVHGESVLYGEEGIHGESVLV